MAEKIISKGFYTHPGIQNFVSVKHYVVIKKGKENQLFFHFENPKNETLTAISFSVDCYDAEGRVVKSAKIEQHKLNAKGHSNFVVNRPVVLVVGCVDFKVTINSVKYGDYCYITHGNDIEVIYEKQDNSGEIDRVPFLHKLGGHTHRSVSRTIRTPRFFMALVSILLIALFAILGLKIYNFTRTEELFTLDKIDYAFATENHKDGPIIIKSIKSTANNIIIPDEIEGHDVSAVASDAFSTSKMRTIEFKGSIEIMDNAFAGAPKLQSVRIESAKNIGTQAFYNCENLTEVAIDKDLETIGQSAFENCGSLKKISLPDTVLTIKDSAFRNCRNLTSLVIPDSTTHIGANILLACHYMESLQTPFIGPSIEDTQNLRYFFGAATPPSMKSLVVTKMDAIAPSLFDGESSFETIKFTAPITVIGEYAFKNCSKLKNFDISASVEEIGSNAFLNCTSLKSIIIPDGVTEIKDNLFKGCSSLKSVAVPSTVTYVGESAFRDCRALASLVLPATVTYIGDKAIYNCTSLTNLVLPFLGSTVTSTNTLGAMIANGEYCILKTLTVLSGDSLPEYAFADFKNLTSITLPSTLQAIAPGCFKNCHALTEINIPNSVTSIGSYAFEGCSSLKSVEIPELVTAVGDYTFSGCSSLKSAVFRNESTQIGEGIFSKCASLTYLNLPDNITTLPAKMCDGCTSLESIIIPSGVTEIPDHSFYDCYSLKNIGLPSALIGIGNYAFAHCQSLPTFDFQATVQTIGNGAFDSCTSITSITIPETVVNIGTSVFSNCSSIASMTAPFPSDYSPGAVFGYYFSGSSSPASLKHVTISRIQSFSLPSNAFNDCEGIEDITLPADLLVIGANAFRNCSSLIALTIPDSVTSMGMGMLIGTHSLERITLPFAGTSISDTGNGFRFFYSDGYSYASPENLAVVTLTKATVIPDYSFHNMNSIHRVNMPETLLEIGSNAFLSCGSLNEVVLPASLQFVSDSAFESCYKLYEVTNLSGVSTSFPYAVRVFSSELERSENKISVGGFSLIRHINATWYLTDYNYKNSSHNLPSGLISNTGAVKYALPERLFYNDKNVSKVNISSDVTRIHSYAFEGCYNLNEITSDQTYSFEEICDFAFLGSSISKVQIPTSTKRIGERAFASSSISSVTLPASVEFIGEGAFEYCHLLENLTFARGCQLSEIQEYSFASTGIKNITLPASLTVIRAHAFEYCPSLGTLAFESNSQLFSIEDYAFFNAGVTKATFPATLQTIGCRTFAGCASLQSVLFKPNSLLTTIGEYAFFNTGIVSITLPAALSDIGSYAFNSCASLQNVSFESNSQLYEINDYAFAGTRIAEIIFPASLTVIGNHAFDNCSMLKSVAFENRSRIYTIGDSAFYNCSALASLSFGEGSSLYDIQPSAFYSTAIKDIKFPASLYSIGQYAFDKCYSLENLTFADGSVLNTIDRYAFRYAGIKTLSLPASLTAIGSSAFAYCNSLESVMLRSSSGISSSAFYQCTNILEVYNLTDADLSVGSSSLGGVATNAIIIHTDESAEHLHDVTVDGLAYKKSDGNWFLMGVAEGSSVTALVLRGFVYNNSTADSIVIYKNAFQNNTDLTSVTIGHAVKDIMTYAFSGCTNIKTLAFDEDCTVTNIASYAFADCAGIQTAILPASIQQIGSSAFQRCSGLETVLLPENLQIIRNNAFKDCTRLYDVMNLSSLNIVKGNTNHGNVGYYALAVRQSSIPLSVTTVTTGTSVAKFAKPENDWYLIDLEVVATAKIVEIPKLIIDEISYPYQIFGCSLQSLYSMDVIIYNTVSKIHDGAFASLSGHTVYFSGSNSEWISIDAFALIQSVYFYADCIHQSGFWRLDENGNVITEVAKIETVIISAPTCKEPGTMKLLCSVCGKEEHGTLPITDDHILNGDQCTVCSKVKVLSDISVSMDNFHTLDCITNDSKYPFAIDDLGVITSQNKTNSTSARFTITADQMMTVTFDYKVSSERNYDFFRVYHNTRKVIEISGGTAYQTYSIVLNEGETLVFEYSKDGSASSGDNCAYVKNLVVQDYEFVEVTQP